MESLRPETLSVELAEGYGASLIGSSMGTERRIDYVTLTVPMMMDYIMQGTQDPGRVDEFASLLSDPANDNDMASVMQTISPIVTTAQARGMVKQLRATALRGSAGAIRVQEQATLDRAPANGGHHVRGKHLQYSGRTQGI